MNVYTHTILYASYIIEKVDSFILLTIILLNKISLNTTKILMCYIVHNINRSIQFDLYL